MTAKNYTQLQELYLKYQPQGLEILGFPCNQFGKQEPGTNQEIRAFVKDQFKITFPMFDKVQVNGPNAHEIFVFLRTRLTGSFGNSVKWNFTKFLCDRNGQPWRRYGPPSDPYSFEEDIIQLLTQPH